MVVAVAGEGTLTMRGPKAARAAASAHSAGTGSGGPQPAAARPARSPQLKRLTCESIRTDSEEALGVSSAGANCDAELVKL